MLLSSKFLGTCKNNFPPSITIEYNVVSNLILVFSLRELNKKYRIQLSPRVACSLFYSQVQVLLDLVMTIFRLY